MNWNTWLLSAAAIGVLASISQAQVSQSPDPNMVSQAQLQNAITAATPPPCPTPLPDTIIGSPGLNVNRCMTNSDATRPTQVQAVTASTAADGSWTASWSFASTPTIATADVLGGTPPYICSITAKSATSVSGKCYQVVSNTLPTTTTALLGLVVSPVQNPAAGLPVMIVGRL